MVWEKGRLTEDIGCTAEYNRSDITIQSLLLCHRKTDAEPHIAYLPPCLNWCRQQWNLIVLMYWRISIVYPIRQAIAWISLGCHIRVHPRTPSCSWVFLGSAFSGQSSRCYPSYLCSIRILHPLPPNYWRPYISRSKSRLFEASKNNNHRNLLQNQNVRPNQPVKASSHHSRRCYPRQLVSIITTPSTKQLLI